MSITDASCEFEALLNYLRQEHGFDFTSYSRSHLMRRVTVRMQQVGVEDISDYGSYLKAYSQEFTDLFNTIEINFTGFFRDAAAWDGSGKYVVKISTY